MRFATCLAFLFVLIGPVARAQTTITGRVVDSKSHEALAFVPINVVGTQQGTVTDIDGRFQLQVGHVPVMLRLSYVGYATLEVTADGAAPLIVALEQRATDLTEVVVRASENPAFRIIRRAAAGRKENDGMHYRSYRYTSYSKTVFTAALDSAVANDPERMARLDTNTREMTALLERQDLFLMESATRKSFIPPASGKEEVLAMRVSGLKDPTFLALAAQTETFSIYDPQIVIGKRTYLGPLAPSATAKYRFILEDTLYQGSDSVYVISYRPRNGTHFDGLKGLLYINTDGYAVQNVTAEPLDRSGGVNIRFQQQHERVGGKAWFPVQLNAFIYLDNVKVNSMSFYGVSRTYLKDVEVDADVARKEVRGPEFVADRLQVRQDEDYWNKLRTDSLSSKDLMTYHVVDSLGESVHLDAKVKWFGALTTGRLAMGPVDLLLKRILAYNGYEGFRLGAGLATNDRVTRYASLGGYFGYGFTDKQWKYGGDLTIKPHPGRDVHLRLSYENDVTETGGVSFAGQTSNLFSQETVRYFYMDRMDRTERYAGEVMFRLGSSLKLWLGSERTLRVNDIGYQYRQAIADGITRQRNDFLIGALTADVRWAFRERIARLPDREVSLGTKYPVVTIHAMRAMKGLWEGEWDITRVDAMVEKTFHIRLVGDLVLRLMGGAADATAPMPFLYDLRGINGEGQFLVAGDKVFETMRPNEFLADRYVAFHLRHSFGTLLVKGKHFHPQPSIVGAAAYGALDHPELHQGLAFSPLSDGFYEAGLRIDGLLGTLGAGVFYRFGPYAFANSGDNFVFKLSTTLAF